MQAAAIGSMPRAPHRPTMTPSMERPQLLVRATTASKDEIAADGWMLSASGGIAHHGSALRTPTTSYGRDRRPRRSAAVDAVPLAVQDLAGVGRAHAVPTLRQLTDDDAAFW